MSLLGGLGFTQSGGQGGAFNKEQSNTSIAHTETVGASDSSLAIGSGSSVNILDDNAIAQSFDFANKTGERDASLIDKSIGLVGAFAQLSKDYGSEIKSFAESSTKSDSERVQQLGLYGIGALVVVAFAFVLMQHKRAA